MTTTTDEDFAGFVAARWPDLEAVALAATLDPEAARELSTAALAGLRGRWAQALDDGAPTAAARRELLERVGTWSPASRPDTAGLLADADPDDSVPSALLAALAAEEPLVRAALAAVTTWEVTIDEVAAMVGRGGPGLVGDVAAARSRLLLAHREALAADGLSAADHRLDDDLRDVLHRLAASAPDPPDPAALVAERTGRARRRTLLLAGAGTIAVGAVGWTTVRGAMGRRARTATTTPEPLARDSEQWASTATWTPRGLLAREPGLLALLDRDLAGARVLFADDTDRLRVVIATDPGRDGLQPLVDGTRIAVWSGLRGDPVESLTRMPYSFAAIQGVGDVVAAGVPYQDAAALVVLTRPTVRSAEFSPYARPVPSGDVNRSWVGLPLTDGVHTVDLDRPLGGAARLRCEEYDGPIPVPDAWADRGVVGEVEEFAAAQVSETSGVPFGALTSEVVVDSPVDGNVLDIVSLSATGGDGRVLVVHVTTPDGAIVRTTRVSDDGRSRTGAVYLFGPEVIPADRPDLPVVQRLSNQDATTGRFLVVAPGGAATAQLLATSPNAYPVSKVVPLKGESAVVPVINADQASSFRLLLEDEEGRTLYDDVVPGGTDIYDLDPVGTGWLGLPRPYDA